jgi:hypothetical protein
MSTTNHPVMVTTIATINNSKIVVIENGEKRVAIKPICQALGVDPDWQNSRIKEDEILGELHKISYATGSDGKQYEMATIPFKYVFGWLFSINIKKVAPEVKDSIIRYKKECYGALYNHFTELDEYMKYRQELAEKVWDKVEAAREDFKLAKNRLDNLKVEFAEARALSLDQYRQIVKQLEMEFPEAEEV